MYNKNGLKQEAMFVTEFSEIIRVKYDLQREKENKKWF